MLLAFLVFLVITALVLGAGYAAIVYGPAALSRRRLDLRLREVSSPESEETADTVVRRTLEGPLPDFERFVMRTPAGAPLASLIAQSGAPTTPGALLLFSLLSAILCGLLALIFVR